MEATDDGYDEALLLTRRLRPKARARTSFVIKNGVSTRPTCRPARSTASRATPSSTICQDLGLSWWKSASRATRSTSPTRPSSPAPPPRSRRSASSTASRSARLARAGHREDPERVLRHRQRTQPQVRRAADQGLNNMSSKTRGRGRGDRETCRATAGVLPEPEDDAAEQPPARLYRRGHRGQGQVPVLRHRFYRLKGREAARIEPVSP